MAKFTDITNHWARAAIEQLSDRNILSGYLDGRFQPDAPLNRAEFAAMLGRAFPRRKKTRNSIKFADVPPSYWAYGVIRTAYQAGFLSGYPNRRFKPTDKLSRMQALLALANGLDYQPQQPVDLTLNDTFDDAEAIPDYAKSAIAAAAEHNLVVNYPHVKQLRPEAIATRAELAAILAQALQTEDTVSPVPDQYIAKVTLAPPIQLTGETRGLWSSDPKQLTSSAIDRIAKFNFNTLYPSVWDRGQTHYPSSVLKRLTQNPPPAADSLAELLPPARSNRLTVIPWFQGGLRVPSYSPIVEQRPHWITTRADGSSMAGDGDRSYVWLNPFHPQVQQFLLDLVVEVVSSYDIDGIQFDSSLSIPLEFGYDRFTTQLYQREHRGRRPPTDPEDSAWIQWRRDRLTNLLQRIYWVMKDYKPYCLLSLVANLQTPAPLQDWQTWQQDNPIEELIVLPSGDLGSSLDDPLIKLAQYEIPVSVGMATDPTSLERMKSTVQQIRDRNLAGVVFSAYETLQEQFEQSETEQSFQSLFPEMIERAQPMNQ